MIMCSGNYSSQKVGGLPKMLVYYTHTHTHTHLKPADKNFVTTLK